MDFLEQPEVKTVYDKCKYIVKRWECQFKSEKGRLPSKLDIREANEEVRYAYRKYFQLKTQALEKNFSDIDAFNFTSESTNVETGTTLEDNTDKKDNDKPTNVINTDKTWGEHLNKTTEKVVENSNNMKPNLNISITKKLFNGSKTSKRNPHRSVSFTQKKPKTEVPRFLSETTMLNSDDLSTDSFKNDSIKIINPVRKIESQPINFVQSVLNNEMATRMKTVDTGWLRRAAFTSGLSFEETMSNFAEDVDDEDIIEESDEETRQTAKKPKLNCDNTEIKRQKLDFSNVIDKLKVPLIDANVGNISGLNTPEYSPEESNSKSSMNDNDNEIIQRQRRSKIIKPVVESSSEEEKDPYATDLSSDPDFNLEETSKSEKISKKTRSQKTGYTKPQEENDTDLSSDLNFNLEETSKSGKIPKKSRSKKIVNSKLQEENDTQQYELEYSIKPRIAVPRDPKLKTLMKQKKRTISDKVSIKDKRQQEIDKFEQKIKNGTLNDNFVRIDLKKKVYVRGKKNMNFSKYKKQQWKRLKEQRKLCGPDMDMGGCDGGELVCFNCGQTGHFARKCPNNKEGTLLPLMEEDTDIPTLEEASKMAKDSQLFRRKSHLAENNTSTDSDESGDEQLLAEVLKLEDYVSHLNLDEYLDEDKSLKALYPLDDDGSLMKTPDEVYDTLRQFGHTSFRAGQELAIMRILSGKSTLLTLSTGSGKSLCYQIPAYLYARKQSCITLVISPLVSLMEDQVGGIPAFLKAACLHTNQTKTQREKVLEMINNKALDVLLVSPEAVVSGEKSSAFDSLIRRLPPIAFVCIDEAHCVSQWSHNFRPSYLLICRVLREKMGIKTILGLTATATRATSDSIVQHLGIMDADEGIISDIPLPENLHLSVSKEREKDMALLSLLSSETFSSCKSIVIYCTRRQECERLSGLLRTRLKHDMVASKKRKRMSVQAEPYHAGLPASRRKSVQKAFMCGELRIVVATIAFGMGINKSDIRAVIHYNMPKNFESYVQEIGRAGRDGLPAYCHLLLDHQGRDEMELQRHIHADSVDRHTIRKLLQKVFVVCVCKQHCPKHEVAFPIEATVRMLDIPEENITTLLCYLELHPKRYVEILSPAYTTCKIVSYNGPNYLHQVAKECPPLAMALALYPAVKEANILEFPVVEIASAMGWDSGICKHKLKNLEWTSANGVPKRSGLNVEFSNLGYRVLAPGNLTEEQLDEALDNLYQHVNAQETTALLQLRAIHQTLMEVSSNCYRENSNEETTEILRKRIRAYFESPSPLDGFNLENDRIIDEGVLISRIHNIISMYRDNSFTGRSIARIFHGISSPNYPAVIWGRCIFWRSHIEVDFHTICKLATAEILKMK